MTWSYSNRCCYISRFESFEIVLIFFVGSRVWDSCIETLAKWFEFTYFDFWFWRKKALSGGSYRMRTPSSWASVAVIAWKYLIISISSQSIWINLLLTLSDRELKSRRSAFASRLSSLFRSEKNELCNTLIDKRYRLYFYRKHPETDV